MRWFDGKSNAKTRAKYEKTTNTISGVCRKVKKSLKKINFFVKSVDKGKANSVEYKCR